MQLPKTLNTFNTETKSMKRGRPLNSPIRENIAEILSNLGSAHGYEIYKYYSQIFPKATQRSIYYQLRRGVALEEFKVSRVKIEEGTFSWGTQAEKTYFSLGIKATPKGLLRAKQIIDKIKGNSGDFKET